jgi:hypothetical protein
MRRWRRWGTGREVDPTLYSDRIDAGSPGNIFEAEVREVKLRRGAIMQEEVRRLRERSHTHDDVPARWSLPTRVAFRFVFCYLLLYAACCGNATLWEVLPLVGLRAEGLAAHPFNHLAQWLGPVFHLHGAGAHLHASGFGDRALDWIAALLMAVLAVAATAMWSVLDRRRMEYRTLFAWLRFTLRLTLAVGMLVYADMKIFPIQIGPPMLPVLNETVGHTSRMTMLWTVLGLSPTYEILCGVTEFVAGGLLLFRRTALAGTLLAGVILTNIMLFDVFFDIPVKLYSANLLLMTLVLAAPDVRPLLQFFWNHRAAAPTQGWVPSPHGRNGRRMIVVVEAAFAVMFCLVLPLQKRKLYVAMERNIRHPNPLTGEWHLEASAADGVSTPYLTGDGQPLSDLFLEPSGRITMRAADGTLWPGGRTDYAHERLEMMSSAHLFVPYTIVRPDATHLMLTPAQGAPYPEMRLRRVPLPKTYPLLETGSHLVNEWGYER